MKKYILLSAFLGLLLSLIVMLPAFAVSGIDQALQGLSQTQSTAELPEGELTTQLGTVINAVIAVIGIIFLILTIYGGFRIMLSSGNPEAVKTGRNILIWGVIGIIIISLAFAITNFVFTDLIPSQ